LALNEPNWVALLSNSYTTSKDIPQVKRKSLKLYANNQWKFIGMNSHRKVPLN